MKKLLIILAALLVASSLVACNNNDSKDNENDTNSTLKVPTNTSGNDEQTTEKEVSNTPATDRTFKETNDKIVIASGSGALNLRTDTNLKDSSLSGISLSTGTVLDRVSTDGEWSKVTYEEKTYYVVNKYTGNATLVDGFEDVSKTIKIKDNDDTANGLNIRAIPDKDSGTITVMAIAQAGDTVKVTGYHTGLDLTQGWYRVEVTLEVTGDDGKLTKKTFNGYMSAHSDFSEVIETSGTESNTSTEDITSAEG